MAGWAAIGQPGLRLAGCSAIMRLGAGNTAHCSRVEFEPARVNEFTTILTLAIAAIIAAS